MKWVIFLSLFCLSFSFVFSYFSKNNKIDLKDLSKSIYDYTVLNIDGDEVSIKSFKGKKIIIVNVASKCGYTPQYEGLEKLNKDYSGKVVVLGFPSNDFLWQEPGKNSEIKEFCSTNYGVTFQLFDKIKVKKGKNQNPLYTWLSYKELNGVNDNAPNWNFCKYLINEQGKLVNFYTSSIKPQDQKILDFINNEK